MLKKRCILLLGGVMLVLLAACNTTTYKHNYTFAGEGEQWSAKYVQTGTEKFIEKKGQRADYETSTNGKFNLTYKGKQTELGEIKHFIYSYKGRSGTTKRTMEGPVRLDDLKDERLGNGAFEQEDSVIKVEVEWDGQQEQFELHVRK